MVASIIDSTEGGEPEVRRWYLKGETYAWMVQEYKRKYDLSGVSFDVLLPAFGPRVGTSAADPRRFDPLGDQGRAPMA